MLSRRVGHPLSVTSTYVFLLYPLVTNLTRTKYYNRWANHEQSAKLSVELYAKTEKKMEEMQITSNLTWIEVQFMKKAVDEVFKCRMTLKWTYAMAYYLDKNNEKELFEDNQRLASTSVISNFGANGFFTCRVGIWSVPSRNSQNSSSLRSSPRVSLPSVRRLLTRP